MDIAGEGFIARLGDRSVVLDLARDKYLLLGKRLTEIALNRVHANTTEEIAVGRRHSRAAARPPLENSKLELPAELMLTQTVPISSDTLWPTRNAGLGLGTAAYHSALALKCLHDVQNQLRRRSFQQTIKFMRDARTRSLGKAPASAVQELLDSFYAARPWFWVAPICRLDALALALLFWRYGHDANLVFGVRLEPFRAHCWVQVSQSALNEPHQRLLQYTHIMII